MLITFAYLLLFATGVIICIQDFRTRLINVFVLLGFAGSNLYLYINSAGITLLIQNVIFSALYFLLMFLIIVLYFFLKNRRLESIINNQIGLGDIIIFLAIGFTLEPETLIYFFTVTFVVSLLFSLIVIKRSTIPLAGHTALIYLLYIAVLTFNN